MRDDPLASELKSAGPTMPMSADLIAELEALMPRLRRFATVLMRDEAQVDDLVQDVVLRAIEKLHLFKEGTNFSGWMFTIMYNRAMSEFRSRRRSPLINKELEERDSPRVSAKQEDQIFLGEVGQAWGKLQASHREVLYLVVIEQLRYEEAAEVLEIPIGTVRSRLSRARDELRVLLEQHQKGRDAKEAKKM